MPGEPAYNNLISRIRIGDTSDAENSIRASAIPYGQVDSTSTATAFTATVPGINVLKDGVCVLLKNGVVTSASGFTINVNGLGAKPCYTNLAAATRDTTIFNIDYTMLFVYDEDRVSGGCWICYRGLEPLIGTTADITPTQVLNAINEGRAVKITHTHTTYGVITASYFNYSAAVGAIVSNVIVNFGSSLALSLVGTIQGNVWDVSTILIPSSPNDIGAQPYIYADGILKGDGNGTITAATAGTDYQAPLVSGTNIKTVNNNSIVGSGNVSVGTVTSVSTGVGLTGSVTTTGTIKANLNSETSMGTIGTTDNLYAVGVDSNNKLAVLVSGSGSGGTSAIIRRWTTA